MFPPRRFALLIGWLVWLLTFAVAVHAQSHGTADGAQPESNVVSDAVANVVGSGPLRVSSANPRYFADGTGKVVYLTGSHTWANFQDNGNGNPPAAVRLRAVPGLPHGEQPQLLPAVDMGAVTVDAGDVRRQLLVQPAGTVRAVDQGRGMRWTGSRSGT